MKGKSLFMYLACMLGVSLVTMALPFTQTASAETIKLRLANYFGPTSQQGELYKQYCDDINKRTDGRVEITYYPGGTLFDGHNTVDGVKNKIADIGYMTTGHYSGRFPVSEAITSMNGFPSAYVVAHVAHDYYQKFKPKEWDEFKVLFAAGHSPMVVFSTKPVRKLEDFSGTKSRVKGKQAEQAKLLGVSPVSIPVGDSFDALSKGVIDNSTTSMEAAKTWRIAEVCKYCTLTWQVFSPPAYYMIMNGDSWNKLPDDIKTIFEEVSAEYAEKAAVMCNDVDVEGAEYSIKMGMEFIKLSGDEAAKWQDIVEPVTEDYVQEMVKKGFAEEEVRGWISYIKERIDYWTKQQTEKGIPFPLNDPASLGS